MAESNSDFTPRIPRPGKRSNLVLKLAVGLLVFAGLGFLFVRSLETTRSEPYRVERAHLGNWALVLERTGGPSAPLLSLRTGIELVSSLFRQVFQRTMESMITPAHASIPVVLHGEFSRGLASHMTPEGLLAAAREAGLEAAVHEPLCLAHLRISEPRSTRQAYVAVVTSPSVVSFRAQLGRTGTDAFDAAALSPIMFVSASDPVLERWLPLRVGADDCLAPIQSTE